MQIPRIPGRQVLLAALLAAVMGGAQAADGDARACGALLLHAQGSAPRAMAPLARKLQGVCSTRSPEMPWSATRGQRDPVAAMQDIAKQIKQMRQEGAKRILLVGQGVGANAAIRYAGASGDVEGVVALGGDPTPAGGFGELPAITPRMKQHVPLLWVVGSGDELQKLGEDWAFAKAPPHPGSRYVEVAGEASGSGDAAGKAVVEWIKGLD